MVKIFVHCESCGIRTHLEDGEFVDGNFLCDACIKDLKKLQQEEKQNHGE